ncbi:pheromone A receptor-domain-containing protein [Russula compacta]|nr:pheromone A receptor-domain-containing protein [Russula compacta]
MGVPPNQVYSAFSFIGVVLCVIPFYWHLEAWNTGTCLYMAWTGLGCLIQCINSIVWNKNMVIRAQVYCYISAIIQSATDVAIPACSLCINRRLYKIATVNAVRVTHAEKRRAVITDLLIGLGLPIIRMPLHYIVSRHGYLLLEDFGPLLSTSVTPLSFVLYFSWPVLVGLVSLTYCVRTIYTLYLRERQLKEIMSSNSSLNRSRYFRLMALASIEILGTIPLGTWSIVNNARSGVTHWTNWADMHKDYSLVLQLPASYWKNIPLLAESLETMRWAVVACAFIFFGFFGFAHEARQHYRLVYTSLATRIGLSTSSGTLHGSSHLTSSSQMKSKGVTISVVTSGIKHRDCDSIASCSDQLSIPSISIAGDLKPDFKIEQYSPSDSPASSSVVSIEPELESQSPQPVATTPAVPPATYQPQLRDMTKSITPGYSGDAADAV